MKRLFLLLVLAWGCNAEIGLPDGASGAAGGVAAQPEALTGSCPAMLANNWFIDNFPTANGWRTIDGTSLPRYYRARAISYTDGTGGLSQYEMGTTCSNTQCKGPLKHIVIPCANCPTTTTISGTLNCTCSAPNIRCIVQ